jgi:large conductance mechanosensitive channel
MALHPALMSACRECRVEGSGEGEDLSSEPRQTVKKLGGNCCWLPIHSIKKFHRQSQEVHMNKEFVTFLRQYGIIGLAIAVIIGGKLNAFVSALVDGIMMPLVTFFIPGGAWRSATLDIGPVHFLLGPVFGAGLDFLLVAWLVFWFSKKILREEMVVKK